MARKDRGKPRINTHDIIGMKFGKLQVLDHAKHWYDKTLGGDKLRHSYLCQCDCGGVVIVRRQCLLNGYTKSCGCLKKGRPRKHGN